MATSTTELKYSIRLLAQFALASLKNALKMHLASLGADYCEEGDKKRRIDVTYTCCNPDTEFDEGAVAGGVSQRIDSNNKGDAIVLTTSGAEGFIKSIEEYKNNVCEYKANVCSPVVCLINLEINKQEHLDGGGKGKGGTIASFLNAGLTNICLQKNYGWWTYEYCYNNQVKQVSERSERALRKTSILAKNPAKWLQTLLWLHPLLN